MSNIKHLRRLLITLCFACALVLTPLVISRAATWSNIEPLKSKRADVEKVLGKPANDDAAGDPNALRFKVAGGSVTVAFVDKKFIENKKLQPDLEGTVLQIIIQHQNASDTPKSLKIEGNSNFDKQERDGTTVYRNVKEGVYYTFIGGKLRTTRYSPSADQLTKAQK